MFDSLLFRNFMMITQDELVQKLLAFIEYDQFERCLKIDKLELELVFKLSAEKGTRKKFNHSNENFAHLLVKKWM